MGLNKNIIISGIATHNMLHGRDEPDAHPIDAITDLWGELAALGADVELYRGFMPQIDFIGILPEQWIDGEFVFYAEYITPAPNTYAVIGKYEPTTKAEKDMVSAADIIITDISYGNMTLKCFGTIPTEETRLLILHGIDPYKENVG